jgi:hypothetical protein
MLLLEINCASNILVFPPFSFLTNVHSRNDCVYGFVLSFAWSLCFLHSTFFVPKASR